MAYHKHWSKFHAHVLAQAESRNNVTSDISTETSVDSNLRYTFSHVKTSDRTERLFDTDEIERLSDSVLRVKQDLLKLQERVVCVKLASWANENNLPRGAVSGLLVILREEGLTVSKDACTLMHTPREYTIEKCEGNYTYLLSRVW